MDGRDGQPTDAPVLGGTELAGFAGAGLSGAAYVPQIWHLVGAHCSAGLSRPAFGVWLASSLLVTSHAVSVGAEVFIVLGAIQVLATVLILAYATKYESSRCASHAHGPATSTPDEGRGSKRRRAPWPRSLATGERHAELTRGHRRGRHDVAQPQGARTGESIRAGHRSSRTARRTRKANDP
jgi:hypothetical protein